MGCVGQEVLDAILGEKPKYKVIVSKKVRTQKE